MIERMPYQEVVSMSAASAREFLGGAWFKTVCVGQATHDRNRFGARVYRLFPTEADWKRYQADRKAGRSP